MRKQKQQLATTLASNGIDQTAKNQKNLKIRVAVYTRSRGSYEEDVVTQENGTFTLKDTNLTYTVARGSVRRGLDGLLHTNVLEDHPQTIDIHILRGNPVIHPRVTNSIATQNYWAQWSDWARRLGAWKSATTWGLMGLGITMLLMMFWMVKTVGTGFEDVGNAMNNLAEAMRANGGGASTPAAQAGHQPIAPGSS
jgi:hypothetical protein